MSIQDTLRKNLTPELYQQVIDALGDDFDYDMVPRSRLNTVIRQRNELRLQLAGVPQTPGGQGSATGEEGDVDIDAIKQQLETQYAQQASAEIAAVKMQYAALDKLRAADAIDPELIWSSNAIDKSKLSMDGDNLVGFDDILNQLKQDKAHLFKVKEPDPPTGTGKNGGSEPSGVATREDFLKLPAEKQIAFKQEHPQVFQRFMQQF